MSTDQTKICEALQRRRLLRFKYKDRLLPTTVEPYMFGEFSNGNEMLVAWLISGETGDATPPMWRQYRADEMGRIEVLTEGFGKNREGYNPNDARFRRVQCRVAPPRSG